MMKKAAVKADRNDMKHRLMKFVVLIVILSTMFIIILGNLIYRDNIMRYAYDTMGEMQLQVQNAIDSKLAAISCAISTFGEHEDVQHYLKLDPDREPENRLLYETKVRNLALSYMRIYNRFINLVVISENGQYLSNDSYRIQDIPLKEEDLYRKAVEAAGAPVILGKDVGRNLRLAQDHSIDSYVSVVQAVYSETNTLLGVILVDWDVSEIQSLADNISMSETGFVFILDDHGEILYAPQNHIIYRVRPSWFSGERIKSCIIQGKRYNLIYNRSNRTGLTTVGMYDTEKTLSAVKNVRYASGFVALLALIFGAAYAAIFSASFSRPVQKLSQLMKRVQNGDFSVRFRDPHVKGEIKQLGESFNAMTDHINHLMEVVYSEQKQKREAELQVLQEQIKPHFLYNTLDTIQWMAKQYHADDIVDMVKSLSHFFRVSLSRGKEFIPLIDELSMIRSYLDIQSYRYEGMFRYEISCPKELAQRQVLRLVLQPIVENALYHGIKEGEPKDGLIQVICSIENSTTLLLAVEDNGAGVTEAFCAEINDLFHFPEHRSQKKLYGTVNVNDRIRLTYGEAYGLQLHPRPGGGTRAEIRIGLREGEDICGKF